MPRVVGALPTCTDWLLLKWLVIMRALTNSPSLPNIRVPLNLKDKQPLIPFYPKILIMLSHNYLVLLGVVKIPNLSL